MQSNFLDKKTAIIEFFVGKHASYAALITKTTSEIYPLRTPPNLDEQISYLRNILATPFTGETTFQEFTSITYELYLSYLQTAQQALPTAVQKLLLIPDKLLGYIPFQTLVKYPLTKKYIEINADYRS